jgi:stress-induced-phosphoprotein 1
MGAYGGDKPDEERVRHAMADPEIQLLLKDPRIVQVLKDFQESPAAAQSAMSDPFINGAINKLIAAGIIKMA